MFPLASALLSAFAIITAGTWVWRASATRARLRELAWAPEQSERLRKIRDSVEGAALLQNVDPWGELAADQVSKLSQQFLRFERALVRRFRARWPEARELHAVGARAFWDELTRLERVASLLQKLDFSDPSFYRSILNATLEPDEEPDLKQTAFAHTELEAHRKLEDSIQQELFHGEQTMLAFEKVNGLLEEKGGEAQLLEAIRGLGDLK